MSIEIYGRPMCFTCEAVISLVESVGAPYSYYNVEQMDARELTFLINRLPSNVKTVPIIIVEGRIIGDINELRQFFEHQRTPKNIMDSR